MRKKFRNIKEFNEYVKDTEKEVIHITFKDKERDQTSSKLGGIPYWDGVKAYPENMIFLAQINFEEVPQNELLPEKGILQFFLENDDSFTYGLFSESNGFQVIYYDNIIEPVEPPVSVSLHLLHSVCDYDGTYVIPTHISILPDDEFDSPIEKSGKMEFQQLRQGFS